MTGRTNEPHAEEVVNSVGVSDPFLILAAESLIRTAPIGFACLDLQLRYRSVNPVLAEFNGRSVEQHLGRSVSEVLPQHAALVIPLFEEIIRTGKSVLNWEVTLRPPSDPENDHHYMASYLALKDLNGATIGIGVSIVDVTAQKSSEFQQRRLKTSLAVEKSITNAVCDQMPAGVAIVEVPSGKIIYHNNAFETVLGHFVESDSVEEYRNYGAIHQSGVSYAAEEYPTARAVLHGETVIAEEMLYRRGDGSLTYLSVSAAPIFDDQRKVSHAVSVFTDIADQKKYLASLRSQADLREQFMTTITHDLRGPLSTAKVSTELVLRYPDKIETHHKFLRKSVEALNRCDRMIGDLLDSHKIKAGQSIPISVAECAINSLVEGLVDEFSIVHGDRFKLIPLSHEVVGFWSAEALRRILENLVSNAVKYGNLETDILIALAQIDGKLELTVNNQGPVLSAEDRANIFGMFSRSDAAEKSGQRGWGIGLALVRGLAEAHGGTVDLESNSEDGTTFKVILPWDARETETETTS